MGSFALLVHPAARVGLVGRPDQVGVRDPSRRAYVRADGTDRITTRFHSTGGKRLFVGLPGR
jgi:hypothetical protein